MKGNFVNVSRILFKATVIKSDMTSKILIDANHAIKIGIFSNDLKLADNYTPIYTDTQRKSKQNYRTAGRHPTFIQHICEAHVLPDKCSNGG